MAASDGPVPVRTLAHAARLMREATQLPRYGITAGEACLDYSRLLDRVHEVTEHGRPMRGEKVIIRTGGVARRLERPGIELTCTHSDAWALSSTPASMLVTGAGATGVQLASIFNAFGSSVTLFEAAPRILMSEDEDAAAAVSAALRTWHQRP